MDAIGDHSMDNEFDGNSILNSLINGTEVKERLSLFESESWSRWKGQVKVELYSLSRMPEHLRCIQCFDLVLQFGI